ncbi:MAG: hypothetical protein SAJ72_01580 [Jaaginema sp. PMC 1080.18]|nr:hypothetical protein [Jaaginema sp. PMC 1080.18]MEC4868765.1 hypothetical protein [Jaaginema sp. PMC 1078.18]
MMALQNWIWIPNQRLGAIEFETPIEIYINSLGAYMSEPKDDVTGFETYEITNEDITIYVENDLVVTVNAYECICYKGINLIGVHQKELINLLEIEPDEIGTPVLYEDGDIQTPLDFDSLGLEAWISNDCVVSCCCSNLIQFEEVEH